MTNLSDIIERLEKAEAGSRELDCWIGYIADLREDDMSWRDKIDRYGINHAITSAESRTNVWSTVLPRYTTSVDAAISLAEKVLPGWAWKLGTCCVSDDAWVTPDFNSPVHGERLKREFPNLVAGSVFDAGVDIDLRPSGRPAIALCIAILTALKAKAQQQEGGE